MPRWTVAVDGAELFVEATADGRISLRIDSGPSLVLSPEQAEDARLKIGAAIGDARDTSRR